MDEGDEDDDDDDDDDREVVDAVALREQLQRVARGEEVSLSNPHFTTCELSERHRLLKLSMSTMSDGLMPMTTTWTTY